MTEEKKNSSEQEQVKDDITQITQMVKTLTDLQRREVKGIVIGMNMAKEKVVRTS